MSKVTYDIYFCNCAIIDTDNRMVQAFLHVIVYDDKGAIVREYDNI